MKPSPILLAGILILTAACSSLEISTSYDYDPDADFTAMKTYNWSSSGSIANVSQFTAVRVRNMIEANLRDKGFERGRNPDFVIALQGGRAQEQRTQWGWSGLEFKTYAEGTLVADMVDRSTNQVIWTGVMHGAAEADPTPAEQDRRLTKAVAELLANFPPK